MQFYFEKTWEKTGHLVRYEFIYGFIYYNNNIFYHSLILFVIFKAILRNGLATSCSASGSSTSPWYLLFITWKHVWKKRLQITLRADVKKRTTSTMQVNSYASKPAEAVIGQLMLNCLPVQRNNWHLLMDCLKIVLLH